LVCHHCHHHRPTPPACPACGAPGLLAFGIGTEQVETILRAAYPDARIARLDRDATQRVGVQERILTDWHAGNLDVLIGTQMVSKGHDVPGVTLVAVLLADESLTARLPRRRRTAADAGRGGRVGAPARTGDRSILSTKSSRRRRRGTHDYATFMRGGWRGERARLSAVRPFASVRSGRTRTGSSSRRAASHWRARRGWGSGPPLGPHPHPSNGADATPELLVRVRTGHGARSRVRPRSMRARRARDLRVW
jgi:primosomal protein N'